MPDDPYFEDDGPKAGECSDCVHFIRKGTSEFGNCMKIWPPIPIHPGPVVAEDQWCEWFEATPD